MGIVSFILGFAVNLIDWLVIGLMSSIGYSMSTFLELFPYAELSSGIFTALGLLFLCVGLVWNIAKGTLAPFGVEYENPIHVVGKVALAWFAVLNLPAILDIVIRFFQIALDYANGLPLGPTIFDDEQWASTMVSSLVIDGTGIASGFLAIVYIISIILLGIRFAKLLVELVERYIVYCFVCLVGPVFVSTAAFKGTRDIAGSWMRTVAGQSFLILLNTLTVRMFLSYCQVMLENLSGMVVDGVYVPTLSMLFFGFAFLNFASRLDTLLRIAGLNTAHTGQSLLGSLGGGMHQLLSAMRVANAAGGVIGNMNSAARSHGGYRTFGGIKAALNSMVSDVVGGGKAGGPGVAAPNMRADGSKIDPNAPGRRKNADTPPKSGDILRQESNPSSQVIKGQQNITDALRHRTGEGDSTNGIGMTNGLKGTAAKMDYMDGGILASAGEQNEQADKAFGKTKGMGAIRQSGITANAVRAAATSAEKYENSNGKMVPLASYHGAEAAAAMNGVTAFDNPHLRGFKFADDDTGTHISGQEFDDGSSVTFDSVEGGIATGVYTDADGNSTAFKMVHTNAVESQEQADGKPFDKSQSVGMVGDGTGKTGYHVIPMTASEADVSTVPFGHNQTLAQMNATVDRSDPAAVRTAEDRLRHFTTLCNPVDKEVATYEGSRASEMKKNAVGSVPGYVQKKKRK